MSETGIEQEIEEKASKAPRVTLDDINKKIVSEHYFTADEAINGHNEAVAQGGPGELDTQEDGGALSLLTFCVLVLDNGFTVTGESACVSPENFDAEIGRKVARENAIDKLWQLEGYLLKERMHRSPS